MTVNNRSLFCVVLILLATFLLVRAEAWAGPVKIGVLMVSQVRSEPVNGMKAGLTELGLKEGSDVVYRIYDAQGDKNKLPELAKAIVAAKPDVAVASGGIESDALKQASKGSGVPVVFLAVASAIERGLAPSMRSSESNLTGIDTNDTKLTAKRLWYITRMLKGVKRVTVFNDAGLTPSEASAAIARQVAPKLGLELKVISVSDKNSIAAASDSLNKANTDVLLLLPSAPVWQMVKGTIYPHLLAEKIPIMGVNRADLKRGAFASYAGSRFETGKQAARLIKKILDGTAPKDIPLETPRHLELVINRAVVKKLGLDLPATVWSLANQVVEMEIK